MGWQIDSGTLVELIGKGLRKGANDNDTADGTGVVDQVLRASSAAAEKGLWSLAELFREWAYELNFGPQPTSYRVSSAALLEEDSLVAGFGAGDKLSPQ